MQYFVSHTPMLSVVRRTTFVTTNTNFLCKNLLTSHLLLSHWFWLMAFAHNRSSYYARHQVDNPSFAQYARHISQCCCSYCKAWTSGETYGTPLEDSHTFYELKKEFFFFAAIHTNSNSKKTLLHAFKQTKTRKNLLAVPLRSYQGTSWQLNATTWSV